MPVKCSMPMEWEQVEEGFDEAIRKSFHRIGDATARWIIIQAPEYTRAFKDGMGFKISGFGFETTLTVFDDSEDAYFVEYGRKPGKQPPPDVMLAWVTFKGLAQPTKSLSGRILAAPVGMSNYMRQQIRSRKIQIEAPSSQVAELKSAAFLIGRAIGARGLPGFHLFGRFRSDPDLYLGAAAGLPSMAAIFEQNIAQIFNGTYSKSRKAA